MPRNTDTTAATQWHIDQAIIRKELYYKNPNKCAGCKLAIIKYEFRNTNKFCSKSCSAKYNNRNRGHKYDGKYLPENPYYRKCLYCEAIIKSKKYCNSNCQKLFFRKNLLTRWMNGETISNEESTPPIIREFMLKESDYKCSLCGWGEINPVTGKTPLAVDHIDGNSRNHFKENLRVLCPNCHSLTPTYGALNKGNGRKKRYKANPDLT